MAYPWEFDEEIEQRLADNNPFRGGGIRQVGAVFCGVSVRSEGASGLRRLFAVTFRPRRSRPTRPLRFPLL